jgi:hypothetical protein
VPSPASTAAEFALSTSSSTSTSCFGRDALAKTLAGDKENQRKEENNEN